jgi:antitoxin ParD1/3/4
MSKKPVDTGKCTREQNRRDQEEQAKARLRGLVTDGLQSGAGRTLTPKVAAELKRRALGG